MSENTPIEYGFMDSASITDYCQYWVPRLYEVNPEQRGYKAQCARFLLAISKNQKTGKQLSPNTVDQWLARPGSRRHRTPDDTTMELLNFYGRDLEQALRSAPIINEVMAASSPKYTKKVDAK